MFKLNLKEPTGARTQEKGSVYDVIIIGAGSAGLTTAIYTGRDGWDTLILEKEAPGGWAASTHLVENYPGFPEGVEGSELMDKFEKQARRFGVDLIDFERVEKVVKGEDGLFEVYTDEELTYQGRSLLLAMGSEPRKLGIPGEEEFANRGVSYCATCDGPLYKGEDVVVIGCGNSGLQEAQVLLEYAKSVTFVEYLDHSIVEQVLQDRVKNYLRSTCLFSKVPEEVKGNGNVRSVAVRDRQTGEMTDIDTSAVFIKLLSRLETTGFQAVEEGALPKQS
ncbi:MAG: FAD-dependent oxidoreductase [Anaerolineales bacterium]